jgi:CheY-like chemotaxis protein
MKTTVVVLEETQKLEPRTFAVLVIGPDAGTRRTIEDHCTDAGIDLDLSVARDGLQAIDLKRSERTPDAVVLGLDLPGVDGRRVLRILRSLPAMQRTPIVLVSASVEVVETEPCVDLQIEATATLGDVIKRLAWFTTSR